MIDQTINHQQEIEAVVGNIIHKEVPQNSNSTPCLKAVLVVLDSTSDLEAVMSNIPQYLEVEGSLEVTAGSICNQEVVVILQDQ